ncbi:MAG: hydrogenase expression/formation protein HypE [Selenomonadaceae bacterium]|nr:hydrogenase expression/formation protein HypE [Selenomonadaceae bacterium]
MTETIQLAHGAGGRMSALLTEEVLRPILGNPILDRMHDGAVLDTHGKIAFTTDSYVVAPRFFPGGSIGRLAVCGTVNDLAMSGAEAKYLSLSLILEEGLAVEELTRVLQDVRAAADEADVSIVTGDTKVVGHGACDGIYINTAGVGEIIGGADIAPKNIRAGMDVIVSGFLGDHAATITAARHGLKLPEAIKSDAAPLNGLVKEMLRAVPEIACMRDPTRGGAAATLNELAAQSETGILLDEELLPVRPEVEGVCELLGFEPLYLANEGKLLAIVPAEKTETLLAVMRAHPYGKEARRIGVVTDKAPGQVAMKTALGGIRIVDMPTGSLVPRIC